MTKSHWDIDTDMPDQSGKVAIVTGGNAGLGKELVRQLAKHGARVYMASRAEAKARAAIAELVKAHPEIAQKKGSIEFLRLDLADLGACQAAARGFLERETRLDVLINNAGIMATPYELTKDGVELQFQSNFLGHFAFTLPLLPLLIETSKDPNTSVRIVQVSSNGHNLATGIKPPVKFDTLASVNRDFNSPWKRYGQSKLANILFARALAARVAEHRIWSNALHPGVINTDLLKNGTVKSYPWMRPLLGLSNWFLVPPYKGAITPLYAATAEEVEKKNYRGQFFVPYAQPAAPPQLAQDDALAQDLWALGEAIVAEKTGAGAGAGAGATDPA